jgi:hypothetical protein
MRTCTFKAFMEQPGVIRFLTFKGLRAFVVTAQLKPVYETDLMPFQSTFGFLKYCEYI